MNLDALLTAVTELALRTTGDHDITQRVVIAVWRRVVHPNFVPTKSFAQWLSGLIRNHKADALRECYGARESSGFKEDEYAVTTSAPSCAYNERVYDAVARLQPGSVERRIAKLMLEGHALKAAATIVGVSESTARIRLRKAAALA